MKVLLLLLSVCLYCLAMLYLNYLIFRPVNPHPRDNHHHRDNYRDEGRGSRGRGGYRGGYRGGSRGGGYRSGPPHPYSSSRGPPSHRYPPPHSNHSNYPPSYRTSSSSYSDYRSSRNDYPPPGLFYLKTFALLSDRILIKYYFVNSLAQR